MKRMLDQKTIDELQALLSKVNIEDDNLVFGNVKIGTLDITDECYVKISQFYNNNSEDFDPIFPLEDNAGKVLAVNEDEDGLEAKDLFAGFTHSLNELDPTLKTLCETAMAEQQPQTCTQAQWNNIKALLDKSLYFHYGDWNMLKLVDDGIDNYVFGSAHFNVGASLEFIHDGVQEKLAVAFTEV